MTSPRTTDVGYEYTEFDGFPLEWWRARVKKRGAIERDIKPAAQAYLAALVPDDAMRTHVARVGQSERGNATLLTTSGHMIQLQREHEADRGPRNPVTRIVVSKEIDHKGVALVMSLYDKVGHTFTADQIPFGKNASDDFKQRVRGMWTEIRAQQEPASARPTAAPRTQTPRAQPAFA